MQFRQPSEVSFGILGPLQVVGNDGPIDLGKSRPREVLAYLLLSANRVVSTGRLIELLWGYDAPAQATATLHTYIAQLRRSLNAIPECGSRLQTRKPGYMLVVETYENDDAQFNEIVAIGQRLFHSGDFAGSAVLFRQSLALWRGPAFAEFATSLALTREAARFEERRLDVLEMCLEAELAVGDRSMVLTELERLVAGHPLRERLRGVYMLALYRSGRQADALRAFQDFRRVLGDELGLDPGPVLRRLEAAILRQDVELELEPAVLSTSDVASAAEGGPWPGLGLPEQLIGVPRSPFIGRGTALREMLDRWATAQGGRATLVSVAGEPGIGKTRLAAEFCRLAANDEGGATVLYGRCTEDVVTAYQPFAEALDRYVRAAPDDLLVAQISLPKALVAVVPAVAYRMIHNNLGGITEKIEPTRLALFDSVSDLLAAMSVHRSVVLVLDDLQWADQSTVAMLGHVLRRYPDRRVMIVTIYRGGEVPDSHPLSGLLVDARRRHDALSIRLVGLDPDETASLAGAWTGKRPTESFVKDLYADSEGNPYFVEELLRNNDEASLAGQSAWRASNDGRMGLPESIDDVLRRRLRRLSEPTYQVLTVGAIAGREFSLDVVEQITSRPAVELAELLEEAISAHLVREIPDSFGKYVFAHGLVRHVLSDAMSSNRRALVHARMLSILETRRIDSLYDALAFHALEALPVVGADRAVAHVERSAVRSLSLMATNEALTLLNRALDRVDRSTPAARALLLVTRNEVLWRTGDSTTAMAGAIEAWELSRAIDDPGLLARAALSRVWLMGPAQAKEAIKYAEVALRELGDVASDIHCRLLGALATKLALVGNRAQAVAVSRSALEMARQLDDPGLIASCLDDSEVLWCNASVAERTQFVHELYSIGQAINGFGVTLNAMHWDAVLAAESGDRESLDAIIDRILDLAGSAQDARGLAGGNQKRAMAALLDGRYDDVDAFAAQAMQANDHPDYVTGFAVQTFMALRDQGRAADVEILVRASLGDHPELADWNAGLALILVERGEALELCALLDRLSSGDLDEQPTSFSWLAITCWLTEAASALGTADHVRYFSSLIEPFGAQCASVMTIAWAGSVRHYLGLAAAALGDDDAAEHHFVAAIDIHDSMQCPTYGARTRLAYAQLLAGRHAGDDQKNAKSLAQDVRAIAEKLGMAGVEHAASQLLERLATV